MGGAYGLNIEQHFNEMEDGILRCGDVDDGCLIYMSYEVNSLKMILSCNAYKTILPVVSRLHRLNPVLIMWSLKSPVLPSKNLAMPTHV